MLRVCIKRKGSSETQCFGDRQQILMPVCDTARADRIEQYLLILESTEYVRDLLTWDRAWANVPLRANDNGSEALLRVAASAERWWNANGPRGYRARTTGIMYEFARAEEEIAHG